jgi:hypothetical protein
MILEDFKRYCLSYKADILVQKYLIENNSHFFDKVKNGEEFEFKKEIASKLDVHIRDIIIVGSGKLGFSLKPEKETPGLYLFREFDSNKVSDLDVAIVSPFLFDNAIKQLYSHTDFYKNSWRERNSLAQYALKGRIATRFLPVDFKLTKEIAEVQQDYQMRYRREVNIEVYKSWFYFETYHQQNIKNIQINLIR